MFEAPLLGFRKSSWWSSPGVQEMFWAVTFFAVVNATVKHLSHIPSSQLVLFRALITLVICVVLLKSKGLGLWGTHRALLFKRGLWGTVALSLYFYTLQQMPLASAVTIQYLSPIFTILIAGFFLGEKSKPLQWLCFFTAFLGVFLVRGFDPRVSSYDVLIGVAAAFGSGMAYNYVRKLKGLEHELVVVMYFPLVTVPLVGPIAVYQWVTPEPWDWAFIFLIGVGTQVAQVFMTRGYQADRASSVSLVNYLGVAYALMMGYFIFDESLSWLSLMGLGIVLLSVVMGLRLRKAT